MTTPDHLHIDPADPFHPVVTLFPGMPDEDFRALVEDIRENGQHQPCLVWKNQIIDGRHRFLACAELGIPPRLAPFDGDSPLAAAVSMNVKRRHLALRERVAVALALIETRHGTNRYTVGERMTQERAAKLLGLSAETPRRARFG